MPAAQEHSCGWGPDFHAEPNMNYQFNRIMSVCGGDPEELAAVARQVNSIEDWIAAFERLARQAEAAGRTRQAAAYWRGVNFYLPPGDPAKRQTYETFHRLSLELARDWLDSGRLVVSAVPYEGGGGPDPAGGGLLAGGELLPAPRGSGQTADL